MILVLTFDLNSGYFDLSLFTQALLYVPSYGVHDRSIYAPMLWLECGWRHIPHRPFLLYDYELKNICLATMIWFAGAYGCILVLFDICLDIWFGYTLYLIWWLGMRACSPITFWELATPLITWGLPSYYIWYSEDSPPNTFSMKMWYGLFGYLFGLG